MAWSPIANLKGPQGEQGPEGGGAVTSSPALQFFRVALTTRDDGPRPIVYTGSSTTEGTGATTAARRYVNILTAAIQATYPLRDGVTSPPMASLTGAFANAGSLDDGVQGVNAGVSGTTAANYLTGTTIPKIAALNPVAIFHMVGSNDFSNSVAPATYQTNLEAQLADLDAELTEPCVHVLIQAYQRLDITPTYPWSAYRDVLAAIAAANPATIAFIDLSTAYVAAGVPGADPFALIGPDNIHQTDSGHAVMAELLRDGLNVPVTNMAEPPDEPPTDTTDPTTPTGLTAGTTTSSTVPLSWTASTDNVAVTGYKVRRDGTVVGTPTGTSFTDTGLTESTGYSYTVSAVDAAGNESAQTSPVSATTAEDDPPVEPTGPDSISGLLASFRADDLTLSDLDTVASWAPSAGSETAALAQATSGQRPVYRTNQIGGQPAVVFTASGSQNMDTGSWSASHAVPVTAFVVGKRNSGNTGNFYSGRNGVYTFLGSGSAGGISIGAGGTGDGFITITGSTWHIYGLVFDGASSAYYYDSTLGTSVTTGTNGNAAQPGVRLSASSAGTSGYLDGAIAEIIFYDRALDDDEVGGVMEWLADKYGITLS